MYASLLLTLSTLQLWMLQCQWHCPPCSYGCSSVSDTVNPAAMEAPVSMILSTLQLWMLQCQWHCQPCSYGCSSVSDTCQPCSYGGSIVNDTVNPAVMDALVSVTLSRLQLWMLQCQWHWSIHNCRVDSISTTQLNQVLWGKFSPDSICIVCVPIFSSSFENSWYLYFAVCRILQYFYCCLVHCCGFTVYACVTLQPYLFSYLFIFIYLSCFCHCKHSMLLAAIWRNIITHKMINVNEVNVE